MKKYILAFTLVVGVHFLHAQKISKIDFNEIQKNSSDSGSVFFYPKLIERILNKDSTLTMEEYKYLYYGNTTFKNYNPYGESKKQSKMAELIRNNKYSEAIPIGEEILNENPVNILMNYYLLICYHNLNSKDTANIYANNYLGFLSAIFGSGDGKSIETAYVVIKVNDEYQILNYLDLQSEGQALLSGTTDRITINTKIQKKQKGKNKISELYFNVSKPFEYLSNQFKGK